MAGTTSPIPLDEVVVEEEPDQEQPGEGAQPHLGDGERIPEAQLPVGDGEGADGERVLEEQAHLGDGERIPQAQLPVSDGERVPEEQANLGDGERVLEELPVGDGGEGAPEEQPNAEEQPHIRDGEGIPEEQDNEAGIRNHAFVMEDPPTPPDTP